MPVGRRGRTKATGRTANPKEAKEKGLEDKRRADSDSVASVEYFHFVDLHIVMWATWQPTPNVVGVIIVFAWRVISLDHIV